MEIPENVRILGLDYAVVRAELEGADGEISPRRQTITLAPGMSRGREEQTYLHELVHGILDQLGYTELYEDERLVQGLAVGLHQALSER
ncbi:hypothetical protein [Slackia heliotrinireducens]|uniref:hypothetical protein n=1 Tax=Slackia heliotrinireducens TaxID=84110 RepID=UPI0033162FF3